MERIDCAVIGAGVVGLAVARALARAGREVVILEAETAIGTGISSRNSEVIHAGIYYARDSLRARLCVPGRRALYEFCASHGVAHRRCGKLIVAVTESQVAELRAIEAKGRANGVDDLQWLDADAARRLEPALNCVAALHSPSTGIIDSHGLMLALLGDAEAEGAMLAVRSPVLGATLGDDIVLDVGGPTPMRLGCRTVINSAGLGAITLARSFAGLATDTLPTLHLAKGNYFTLTGKAPFQHLIYPIPEPAGLGVHLTLDLGGQAKFGPDVEWVERIDYAVDTARGDRFHADVRRYWPGLADGALSPGYCGIRPKITPRGEPQRDFLIQGPANHGIPGLVNLFGIESPGLTACLAIADLVRQRLACTP